MSNRSPNQAKLDTFFSARIQVESVRFEDDDEVLQAPSASTTVGVVFES